MKRMITIIVVILIMVLIAISASEGYAQSYNQNNIQAILKQLSQGEKSTIIKLAEDMIEDKKPKPKVEPMHTLDNKYREIAYKDKARVQVLADGLGENIKYMARVRNKFYFIEMEYTKRKNHFYLKCADDNGNVTVLGELDDIVIDDFHRISGLRHIRDELYLGTESHIYKYSFDVNKFYKADELFWAQLKRKVYIDAFWTIGNEIFMNLTDTMRSSTKITQVQSVHYKYNIDTKKAAYVGGALQWIYRPSFLPNSRESEYVYIGYYGITVQDTDGNSNLILREDMCRYFNYAIYYNDWIIYLRCGGSRIAYIDEEWHRHLIAGSDEESEIPSQHCILDIGEDGCIYTFYSHMVQGWREGSVYHSGYCEGNLVRIIPPLKLLTPNPTKYVEVY